jgi:WD40 repeat protein
VRIWKIGKQSQVLEASMKDHRGPVNCIRVKANDDECVSASSDGSCIIWDLKTYKRRTSLFANTCFKAIVYHPDESQLVTTGTDRKVRDGLEGACPAQTCAMLLDNHHVVPA